jgi:glycerate 2-kinase
MIMVYVLEDMEPNRFATHSLTDPRVMRILSAALDAVEPAGVVRRYLTEHPLNNEGRIFGLGIGKAAVPMLDALAGLYALEDGLAVTKYASHGTSRGVTVMEGGHPVPDARSLAAGERVLEFASRMEAGDLLVCLISGGGSALVSAPHASVELKDMQSLTSELLASGARIDEINTLRRHLDRVKGGGLLRVATNGRVISLVLSDVVGNPLEAIASGPSAPDPSTRADALSILAKYHLEHVVPKAILDALHSAPETLKVDDPVFDRVQNVIVGDNALAAQAAKSQAEREGFTAEILTTELQGEARIVGQELAQRLRTAGLIRPRPFCLIAGGETTVTLTPLLSPHRNGEKNSKITYGGDRGKVGGKGGRNQELALAAVDALTGIEKIMLVSFATDGDDGPTDAAGAVVTGESAQRAESLGLAASDHLSRNDAYPFFETLGDLLKPGYTGTNVNDLVFLIAFE